MNEMQDNPAKQEKQEFSFVNDKGSHRDWLKEASITAKLMVQQGACESVNDFLLSLYEQQGHKDLATFEEWKKRGYSIKKGSRALVIWGKPRPLKTGEPAAEGEEKEGQFFPLCYLFSSAMVTRDEKPKQ